MYVCVIAVKLSLLRIVVVTFLDLTPALDKEFEKDEHRSSYESGEDTGLSTSSRDENPRQTLRKKVKQQNKQSQRQRRTNRAKSINPLPASSRVLRSHQKYTQNDADTVSQSNSIATKFPPDWSSKSRGKRQAAATSVLVGDEKFIPAKKTMTVPPQIKQQGSRGKKHVMGHAAAMAAIKQAKDSVLSSSTSTAKADEKNNKHPRRRSVGGTKRRKEQVEVDEHHESLSKQTAVPVTLKRKNNNEYEQKKQTSVIPSEPTEKRGDRKRGHKQASQKSLFMTMQSASPNVNKKSLNSGRYDLHPDLEGKQYLQKLEQDKNIAFGKDLLDASKPVELGQPPPPKGYRTLSSCSALKLPHSEIPSGALFV